jgi:hypothetical protein
MNLIQAIKDVFSPKCPDVGVKGGQRYKFARPFMSKLVISATDDIVEVVTCDNSTVYYRYLDVQGELPVGEIKLMSVDTFLSVYVRSC